MRKGGWILLYPKNLKDNGFYIDCSLLDKFNSQVPKEKGIYLLFNNHYELLYIGQSIDLNARVSSHLRGYSHLKEYHKDFRYLRYITMKEANGPVVTYYEKNLIKTFNPKYNSTHNQTPHLGIEECFNFDELYDLVYRLISTKIRADLKLEVEKKFHLEFRRLESQGSALSSELEQIQSDYKRLQIVTEVIELEKATVV